MDTSSISVAIKFLSKLLIKEKSLSQNNPFLNETKEAIKPLINVIRTSPIKISYKGKVLADTTIKTLGGDSDVLLYPRMKHYREMHVAISFRGIQREIMGYANSEFFPKEFDVNKYSFMFNQISENSRLKYVQEDVILVNAGVSSTELYKVYLQFETLGEFLNYLVRFKEHIETVTGLRF